MSFFICKRLAEEPIENTFFSVDDSSNQKNSWLNKVVYPLAFIGALAIGYQGYLYLKKNEPAKKEAPAAVQNPPVKKEEKKEKAEAVKAESRQNSDSLKKSAAEEKKLKKQKEKEEKKVKKEKKEKIAEEKVTEEKIEKVAIENINAKPSKRPKRVDADSTDQTYQRMEGNN